jgi:hypothetical protein
MTMRARLLAALLAVALLVVGSPAASARTGITEGEAKAVLNAQLTGGLVVIDHQIVVVGAPGQLDVRIHPFLPDAHYCVLDWHTIQLTIFVLEADYPSRQEAFEAISLSNTTFALDGVPLPAEELAIKRVNGSFGPAFGQTTGLLSPPGSVAVGDHVLQTTVIDQGVTAVFEVGFTIDGPSTGACL